MMIRSMTERRWPFRRRIRELWDIIASPIVSTTVLFAAITCLLSFALAMWMWSVTTDNGEVSGGLVKSWIVLMSYNSGIAWCGLLVYNVLMRWHRVRWVARVYIVLLIAVCLLSSMTDAVLQFTQKAVFNTVYAEVALQTNFLEGTDFADTYLTGAFLRSFVSLYMAVAAVCVVVMLLKKAVRRWRGGLLLRVAMPMTVLAGIGIAGSMLPDFIKKVGPFGKIGTIASLKMSPEFHFTDVRVERVAGGDMPENIAVIIGESMMRSHCSLYGYPLPTTDSMDRFEADSLLCAFTDVSSPATSTVRSFKSFMTTWSESYTTSQPWYEHPSFIEMAKKSGYNTAWLSNQSAIGFLDNEVSRLASLSDYVEFASNDYSVPGCGAYDERLIAMLAACVGGKLPPPRFVVLHLMGQHFNYKRRYPVEYGRFSEKDYAQYPEHQRSLRSQYDNAVAYGDSVMAEMIHEFDGKDAVVIFFSDHGEDLFVSDENYHGHGKENVPASYKVGTEIPFVIYFTPIAKDRHARLWKRVASSTGREGNTDDFIYTLMDIMGCREVGGDERYGGRSLLAE